MEQQVVGLAASASAPELGAVDRVGTVPLAVAKGGGALPTVQQQEQGLHETSATAIANAAGDEAATPEHAEVSHAEQGPGSPQVQERRRSPLSRQKKEVSIQDLINEYASAEGHEPEVESSTELLKRIKSDCSVKLKKQNVEANRKLGLSDAALDPERAREVAAKEAAADQTFPMWIKKRHDFQQVFQRFAFEGINIHEVILDALQKHPDERKGDTVSVLMKWAKKFPIFSELSDRECAAVARKLRMQTYNEGDFIFKQGDPGYSFFMIFEGSVEVLVDGKRVKVQGAGESFGDLALKTDQPRAASIRALKKNTACAVLRSFNFREALAKFQTEQLNEAATFLKAMPMFENWSKNKLGQLGSLVNRVEFMEGDIICRQGDALKNSSLYLIQDGVVECYRFFSTSKTNRWPSGHGKGMKKVTKVQRKSIKLGRLTKGDYFGEDEILGYDTQQCTIVAATSVKLFSVFRRDQKRLLNNRSINRFMRKHHRWMFKSTEQLESQINRRDLVEQRYLHAKLSSLGPKFLGRLQKAEEKALEQAAKGKRGNETRPRGLRGSVSLPAL